MYNESQKGRFVKEVCEYGIGASMTRPGLQEVTELVCAGQTNLVLIQNLSRLSRQKQEADDFLNLLHQRNVTLFSLDEVLELPPHQELNITLLASL